MATKNFILKLLADDDNIIQFKWKQKANGSPPASVDISAYTFRLVLCDYNGQLVLDVLCTKNNDTITASIPAAAVAALPVSTTDFKLLATGPSTRRLLKGKVVIER